VLFDQVGFDPRLELAAGMLIDQRGADLRLDLTERADPRDFVVLELDDMKAVAGANNRRNLAGLQGFDARENLVHDVARLEPAEFAAVGFGVDGDAGDDFGGTGGDSIFTIATDKQGNLILLCGSGPDAPVTTELIGDDYLPSLLAVFKADGTGLASSRFIGPTAQFLRVQDDGSVTLMGTRIRENGTDHVFFRLSSSLSLVSKTTYSVGPLTQAVDFLVEPAGTLLGLNNTGDANAPLTSVSWVATQPQKFSSFDAYVYRLDPTATRLLGAARFGSSRLTFAFRLALGPTGEVVIAGSATPFSGFPIIPEISPWFIPPSGDIFVDFRMLAEYNFGE